MIAIFKDHGHDRSKDGGFFGGRRMEIMHLFEKGTAQEAADEVQMASGESSKLGRNEFQGRSEL